jgi:hypothetical protein
MRRRALLFQEVAHRRMVTFQCDTHTNIIVVDGTRNRDLTLGLTLKKVKNKYGTAFVSAVRRLQPLRKEQETLNIN